MKLKRSRNVHNISLYKICFVLPLLMCFRCYGNLKFPLTYNEKSESVFYCYLTADTCILTERFYKYLLSSKEVVQIPHFDLLPWHPKV